MSKKEKALQDIVQNKWEYYRNRCKNSLCDKLDLKVLKTDLNIYIESDEDIIKLGDKNKIPRNNHQVY